MNPTIALVVGGSEEVFEELAAARALCGDRPTATFVCNSMIEVFPGVIDYALTLHPEETFRWLAPRRAAGLPEPRQIWSHRSYTNITHWVADWGGSCSLFATRVARQENFEKIILCGCPMTVENKHYKRHAPWFPAIAFRRGWAKHKHEIPERCVRSMSGWTREQFRAPDIAWLDADLDIPRFRPHIIQPGLKA